MVAVCANREAEIGDMDDADKMEFLNRSGPKSRASCRVIRAGHDLLGLQNLFHSRRKEVRAWTIAWRHRMQAAAGSTPILEKGFIRAQTISFADLFSTRANTAPRRGQDARRKARNTWCRDGDVLNPVQRLTEFQSLTLQPRCKRSGNRGPPWRDEQMPDSVSLHRGYGPRRMK